MQKKLVSCKQKAISFVSGGQVRLNFHKSDLKSVRSVLGNMFFCKFMENRFWTKRTKENLAVS